MKIKVQHAFKLTEVQNNFSGYLLSVKMELRDKFRLHNEKIRLGGDYMVSENNQTVTFTAWCTLSDVVKSYLAYLICDPAPRIKVYGTLVYSMIAFIVCIVNKYSVWYAAITMAAMWGVIIYGTWRNFTGKTA